MVSFLWLIVVTFGQHSFLKTSIDTLYAFYALFGIWPFAPDILIASLLSGAMLNLAFLWYLFGLTILFALIFWHSFYFGYLLLSAIGSGKRLPDYYPSISVLLPALNEAQYIGGTLDALLGSNYPEDKLEIIVITSGSTDETTDIAKAKAKTGTIRVLTKPTPTKGKPAALHYGLTEAKNEVVVILDAETRMEPDALRELVKPLQQPNIVAVQGTIQVANPDVNKLTRAQAMENAWYNGAGMYQDLQQKRNQPFFLLGRNYCVRRDLLQQLGGYEGDSLTEDIHITFELFKQKGRIAFARFARAWEDAPDNWEAVRTQRLRWAAGWNIENKQFMDSVEKKRPVILNLLDFLLINNGVAFYPIFGTIIGLIVFLLGEWLIAMMFLLPVLFSLLLQAAAGRRYAGRARLVTSFLRFFRLYLMMFRLASRPPEIPEWTKTEKPGGNSSLVEVTSEKGKGVDGKNDEN